MRANIIIRFKKPMYLKYINGSHYHRLWRCGTSVGPVQCYQQRPRRCTTERGVNGANALCTTSRNGIHTRSNFMVSLLRHNASLRLQKQKNIICTIFQNKMAYYWRCRGCGNADAVVCLEFCVREIQIYRTDRTNQLPKKAQTIAMGGTESRCYQR